MTTTFSAGPHALGYLYQARVALHLLLQVPDEAVVKIEGLDDIELIDPTVAKKLSLTQLKHHISGEADLTDYGVDLWKTIRVWATQVKDKSFALRDTRLYLFTTAKAATGSAAAMLGPEGRDLVTAEKQLTEVAVTSTNKALQPSFTAFLGLSPAQRTALVSSIVVLDGHDDIDSYRTKIRQQIRPAVRAQHVDGLYERLEGWWFNLVVAQLLGGAAAAYISAFDLNEKIATLAESFQQENLPLDYLYENPDEEFVSGSSNKMFVRQLIAIKIVPRSINKAIVDYYRAFHQRSRWLQEDLISAEELTNFETLLVDEWERYADSLASSDEVNGNSKDLIEMGKNILRWAELDAAHLRIRPRVGADYVRRGSFQMLADKAPYPSIYWHPEFRKQLDENLISPVII